MRVGRALDKGWIERTLVMVAMTALSACSAGDEAGQVSGDDCSAAADGAACEDQVSGDVCSVAADGAACDDGEMCTVDDRCKAGSCVAGPNICDCAETADCASLEDANACNGTLYCDTKVFPSRCRVNPATVVTCPAVKEPCTVAACNADTGKCEPKPLSDNVLCDDGEPCSVADRCIAGKCAAGVDICACHTNKDCLDDSDKCNGTPYCDTKKVPYVCRPNKATVVTCSSGKDTGCKKNACDPALGTCALVERADDTTCDDGNLCTTGDACKAGVCVGDKTSSCACTSDADCALQEDGDLCNGTLFCNQSTKKCALNPKTVVTCSVAEDSVCVKNVCGKATGLCKMTPVTPGTSCDDGDKCTQGEVCVAGACGQGTNTCKCSNDGDCADKDDGNKCNGVMFCNKQTGACQHNPATVVTCPTVGDTECLKTTCVPLTGACTATAIADSTACSDSDKCTTGEVCAGGKCAGGTYVCSCESNADCVSEEDGNLCNGTLFCNKSLKVPKCELNPATTVTCPSVNDTVCIQNTCQVKTGKCWMIPVPSGKPCDDGSACTKTDYCAAGKCQGGANTCECEVNADCEFKYKGKSKCDGSWYCDKSKADAPKCKLSPVPIICPKLDGQPCLANACNPLTGKCQAKAINEGKACDGDGDQCTVDQCKTGQCLKVSDKVCDDNDKCTNDNCSAAKGCVHTDKCDDGNSCTKDLCKAGQCSTDAKAMDASPCDADQNGCTQNDGCKAGTCAAGVDVICQVKTGECQQPLCVGKGSNQFSCQAAGKPNGTLCEDGDPCTVGSVCIKGQCSGQGKEKLGAKLIAPPSGQQGRLVAMTKAANGGFVAVGQTWTVAAGKSDKHRWWVQRLSATGEKLWHDNWAGAASADDQGAVAVLPADGGAFLVGGTAAASKSDTNLRLARLSPDGKPTWSQQYGTKGDAERLADLVADSNSNATLAGVKVSGGVEKLYVVRVAATGKLAWTYERGDKGDSWLVGALIRRNSGELYVAGSQTTKAGERAFIEAIDDGGKLKWTFLASPSVKSGFDGLVRQGDGALTAVGWVDPGAGLHSWVVGVTDAGYLRWKQQGLAGSRLSAVWPLAGSKPGESGGAAMAGTRKPLGGSQSLWVTGTDRFANTRWNHLATQLKDAGLGTVEIGAGLAIEALGKDGFAVLADGKASGKSVAVLSRVDPWGHGSCQSAGKCLGKPVAFCEDGNACTADFCNGVSECQHAAAKGMLCDPDDGCSGLNTCAAGACPAAQNGVRFTKVLLAGKPAAIHDVAALANGGFGAVGQATEDVIVSDGKGGTVNKGKKPQGVVMNTDPYGEWTSSALSPGWYYGGKPAHSNFHRIAARKNGGFIALRKGSMKHDQYLFVYDAKGKQIAANRADKTYGSHWLHSLVSNPDGSMYVLTAVQYDGSKPQINPKVVLVGENGEAVINYPARFIGCAMYSCAKMYPGDHNPGAVTGDISWNARMVRAGKQLMIAGQMGGWGAKPYPNWGSVWLGRFDPATKKWFIAKDILKGLSFMELVGMPDGGAIVLGTYGGVHKTGTVGGAARYDTDGNELWHKTGKPWTGIQPLGAVRLPSGNILLVGSKRTVATWFWWIGELSPQGELLWQRQRKEVGWLRSVKRLANGDLLIGGTEWVDKKVRGVLMRADPWGHGGCAESGKCVSTKPDACDDKNPCTGDYCDPKDGCKHPVLADKASCDDGQACTEKDACAAGKCAGTKKAGCE